MKSFHNKIGVSILLVFFVILGTAQEKVNVSKWPRGVTYEIFVQSFADSDGDGIGDINGMTSKLDYLKELGVGGIWLMPISPSTSYHKYNVDDYYDIHPDYGTLDDFKRFIIEAHKRDIHVVIDLVINHSGRNNKWFQEALKDSGSRYWDYYVWTHKNDPQTGVEGRIISADSRNRNRWNRVEGSDYLYYSYFGGGMPDLNFDNPKLREEIFKVGKFWLDDIGVDGFRLDAARHIFPDDRPLDNHRWWEYFLKEMKTVKEDVYLIGEVWAAAEVVGPYMKGLPALFNFDMGSRIIKSINDGDGTTLATEHKKIMDFYDSINPEYIDAIFLTNHDQNRVLSSLGTDKEKAKLAASFLLTLPGSPYLYYGEEIGMVGVKPDQYIREPFLWDKMEKDKARATWIQPRYSADSTVVPLSFQLNDENSIYNHYKKFISLRNNSAALTYGDLTPVDITNTSLSAFIRSHNNESLFVIHNLSSEKQVAEVPSSFKEYVSIYYSNKDAELRNGQIEVPAYSTTILTK
jgi:alpha-amylase